LQYHRSNLKKLNDAFFKAARKKHVDNPSEYDRRDINSQAYRGAFVEVMATWEGYVQSILLETVEIFISCLAKQVRAGVKLHPTAEKMLQKCTPSQIALVGIEAKVDRLESYKQVLQKKCSRLIPVFGGRDGINKRFQGLFEQGTELSEMIEQMGPVSFSYLNKDERKNNNLQMATKESFEILLRLFYGARCVYVHGSSDKTFQQGGVLHNFPHREGFYKDG